jgi:hypothetical protein
MTEVETLRARIPSITIHLEGASPTEVDVTIDGNAVARSTVGTAVSLDPGSHVVVGKRGDEIERVEVTVPEGRSEPVMLRFATRASTPPSVAHAPDAPRSLRHEAERGGSAPQRTLGWVGIVAGGAGLATGGVFGGLAASKRSAILRNPACQGDRCPPSERDNVETLRLYRTLSTVSLITGGVLAGAGLTLVLTSGSDTRSNLAARVGPGSLTLEGSF